MIDTNKAQELIDNKACILFDRVKVWKNYQMAFLEPPPYNESVIGNPETVKAEEELILTVVDAAEKIALEARKRNYPDNYPIVLKADTWTRMSIITLEILESEIPNMRRIHQELLDKAV